MSFCLNSKYVYTNYSTCLKPDGSVLMAVPSKNKTKYFVI